MFKLFWQTPMFNRGINKLTDWPYITRNMRLSLTKVRDYYEFNKSYVPNTHVLVPFLTSLNVSMTYDLYDYARLVSNACEGVARIIGFTLPSSQGKIHKNNFYKNCNEIIIAYDNSVDYQHVNDTWRTYCAVTVAYHPFSDIDLARPSPTTESDRSGMVCICINMTALAVQYRAFIINEWLNNRDSARNVTHFIASYVLPNMTSSHTDLCIVNRLIERFNGVKHSTSYFTHPFSLPGYTPSIDADIDRTLKTIQNTDLKFDTVLKTIPCLTADNALDALVMPTIARASQNDWALLISRLYYMKFLFEISGDKLTATNMTYVEDCFRALKDYNTRQKIQAVLPDAPYYQIEDCIETMLYLAGRSYL